VFLILGVNGLINPIEFNPVLNTDLVVLAVGTILLLVSMFTLGQNKIDRWEAFVFLLVYAGYTYYLFERN
jgi:cation:H+ antiporter